MSFFFFFINVMWDNPHYTENINCSVEDTTKMKIQDFIIQQRKDITYKSIYQINYRSLNYLTEFIPFCHSVTKFME